MKKLRATSLQIRLASIAILVLLIGLAAAAYFSGRRVQSDSDLIVQDAVPGTIEAHYMRMAMSRSIGWVMVAASAQTTASRDASLKIVHDADVAFAEALNQYKGTIRINQRTDLALLKQVESTYADYYRQRMAYEALILSGDRDRSAAFLENDLVPAYLPAIKSAEELLKYNHGNSISLANAIRRGVHQLYWAVAAVMILALACAVVLVVNLSIRRRELAELQENEEKFSKAFRSNPCGIAITEIETGRYVEVNDSFCRIMGYPPQEVIGRTTLELGIWNSAEERSRIIEPLLAGRSLRHQEVETSTRDGARKTVSLNAELIELDGERCLVTLIEDITGRKQTERALQASEALLRHFIKHTPAAVAMFDTEMRYLQASDRWITDYHLAGKDVIGRSHYEVFPDIPERWKEVHRKALRGRPERSDEDMFPRADGGVEWLQWEVRPWHASENVIGGVIMFTQVITERKRIEAKLRESEELFRTSFESATVGVCLVATDGRFFNVNRTLCDMLGYSKDELLQLTFNDVTHEEDKEVGRTFLTDALSGGPKNMQMEKRYLHKDGRVVWAFLSTALVDQSREHGGYLISYVQDITERKRATEQLELLKASIDKHLDGAFWMDTSNRFVYVNDSACKSLGYAREELLGQPVTLVAPLATPQSLEGVWKSLRETAFFTRESVHRRKDGSEFPVEIVASYVRFEGKEFNCGFARDITERKHLEHKQAELVAIVASSDDAIIGKSLTGIITSWNRGAERIFGYSAAEAIGQPLLMLMPADRRHEETDVLEKIARGEAVEHFDTVRIRKDGRQIYISATISPLKDGFGKVTGASKIARDITAQKQAELRIRHLNRVYEVLSDINKTIVREKNPQAMLAEACRVVVEKGEFQMAWVGLFDAAAQKVLPVTSAGVVDGYLDLVNIDLRDKERSSGPSGRCFLSGEHATCGDIEHEPFVGVLRDEALKRGYRSSACFPLKVGGKVAGVFSLYSGETGFFDDEELRLLDELALDIGFALEVSEGESKRRQAELELRWRTAFFEAQVQSAIDGILVVDSDGKKLLQNRRLNELWKIPAPIADDPDDSKQFQFVLGRVSAPEAFAEKTAYLKAHPDESSSDVIELVDGTLLERYSAPVRGNDGTYYGRVWTFHDITERKKLEQQFLRAQRMESIGTLASGLAHDLNNILTPIMMSAPVLRLGLSEKQREEIIDTIEMSAVRGAQIVKQVLTFGRGLDGEKHPLQVQALISEMVKMIGGTFPKDIIVESTIEPDLWMVLGDGTQLHQVLLNLCVNARDAMPDGGRLRLSAANLDIDASYASMLPDATPGPHVLVEVSDTGSGIPPEILERIFDPFFTTKEVGKGTGLGLSTVHGIIKNLGGLLNVISQAGKGTTFQVYLPAAPDQEPVAAAVSLGIPPTGHGELVLVVDDEPAITNAARTVLEAHGYRVLLATNGAEALTLFAQHSNNVAVVLTDVMMPLMNGVNLLRALRKIRQDVPVIASTGLGERAQLDKLEEMGVKTTLRKPYHSGVLLRTIHGLLHPRAEDLPGLL